MELTDVILFVVDDDQMVRNGAAALARSLGVSCQTFVFAEEFLDHYDPSQLGCLLVDLRLGGMSGIELQAKLIERRITIPVILFTAFADVTIAVRAMQQGAMTVIEKPYSGKELSDAILAALESSRQAAKRRARFNDLRKRIDDLTAREHDVMQRVVAGEANKVIAHNLDLSMRTVARLRGAIFDKLGCDSAVGATRIVTTLDMFEHNGNPAATYFPGDSPVTMA